MKKYIKAIEALFACALIAVVVALIACQTSSTNSNSNFNTNTNTNSNTNTNTNTNSNSNTNSSRTIITKTMDISKVEPKVVGICETYADKITLFCKNEPRVLTEWQKKAITERDTFINECISDGVFEDITTDELNKIEAEINNASDCSETVTAL